MRNILCGYIVSILMILSISAQNQIYFEDFKGGMPNNFKFFNQDTLVPAPPTSIDNYNTDFSSGSWVFMTNYWFAGDSIVASTCLSIADSFGTSYTGEQVDDWMITPAIIIGENAFLTWKVFTQSYEESPISYEVRISNNNGDTTTDFVDPPIFVANPDSSGTWQTRSVFLKSKGYSNDTIYIAFRHNTNTIIPTYQGEVLFIDDIEVYEVMGRDVVMETSSINEFVKVGQTYPVSGMLSNQGIDTIHSIDVNWSVDGGSVFTKNLSGLNILFGQEYNYTHDSIWTPTTVGSYSIKIWTSNLNGLGDEKPENDTIIIETYAMSAFPGKSVLVENITDASCGFCVDGFVAMDNITNTYSNVIPINIHKTDAMSFQDGIDLSDAYSNASGNTKALIDRKQFSDQTYTEIILFDHNDTIWKNKTAERLQEVSPVAVHIDNEYDNNTRELSITVSAAFYAALNGEYRFNCLIIEDSIAGSGTGYDQSNARVGQSGHPYAGKGDPVTNFYHRNVLRFMLGNEWGSSAGSIPPSPIPTNIEVDDSFTIEYTLTLSEDWNPANIKVVGLIQKWNVGDPADRLILNAVAEKLNFIVQPGVEALNFAVGTVSVYPNPANEYINIYFELEKSTNINISITDMLGRTVQTVLSNKYLPEGTHLLSQNIDRDLPKGNYILNIQTDSGERKYQKFVLVK